MLSKENAEYLSRKFREDNHLGSTEAIELKSLLLKNDILTVFRPMSDNAYGLSVKSGENRFILINSNNPIGRQHFTIAHELYHLYYDPNPEPHLCANSREKDSEKEADMFAAALLMPQDGLTNMLSLNRGKVKTVTMAQILKLEQYYRVSHNAMVVRLKKLKYISEEEFRLQTSLAIATKARQYGYDTSLYEKGNEGLVIGSYGEMARRLYDAERISESHYEELLKLIDDGKNA